MRTAAGFEPAAPVAWISTGRASVALSTRMAALVRTIAYRWRLGHAVTFILLATLLSACETIPPPPQIVHVAIPTSCVRSVPARPFVHTDPALSALDDFKFVLALFSDRRSLLDYSAELEAVLQACK